MQENLSRSKPRWMDEECANSNTTPKTVDLRLNLRRCSDLTLRVNLLHLRAFLTISASCWFLLQILNYIIQITIQPKALNLTFWCNHECEYENCQRAFPCKWRYQICPPESSPVILCVVQQTAHTVPLLKSLGEDDVVTLRFHVIRMVTRRSFGLRD